MRQVSFTKWFGEWAIASSEDIAEGEEVLLCTKKYNEVKICGIKFGRMRGRNVYAFTNVLDEYGRFMRDGDRYVIQAPKDADTGDEVSVRLNDGSVVPVVLGVNVGGRKFYAKDQLGMCGSCGEKGPITETCQLCYKGLFK